ncbi:IclR family transcriptional regulator [Salinibaculum salinum]|uniref:IclR family transcriptional regulator n=1 Tax=Salinibaculum salinum TaxID=3131996 RepID=UPI0030EE85E3
MSKDTTEAPRAVKSTDRTFRIVESLKQMDGARVTELARELDMANSTVHRHLQSLLENKYVVKKGDVYHLGMRFLDIGDYVRNRREVFRLAEDKVNQLAEKTDERGEFLVEEYGEIVFVHREVGDNAVQADSHIGKRLPIHATSAGKAIMAFLPDERVSEIIEQKGLESYTENTITDEETLRDELEQIREDHVAFAQQEYIQQLNSVSVPIIDVNDRVCGALGISGPAHRIKGEWFQEEVPDLLLGFANELEIKMSY